MGRFPHCVLLATMLVVFIIGSCAKRYNKHCKKHLKPITYDLQDSFCDQPEFVTFVQRTEENLLLDNICQTYFPLPDDSSTYQVYVARVFCDGSLDLMSFIATQMGTGVSKYGSPYCTFTETAFGNAGCDTRLVYRCYEHGDCGSANGTLVLGVSPECKQLGLSCLDKFEEAVNATRMADLEYYALPMKLPNKCVQQQLCLENPNPFYGHLPGHRRRIIRKNYCDQPMFATFLPRTEENELLDNVCYTYFPLPDDPDTFQLYISRVFCDGSSDVISLVATQFELGVYRQANPYCTQSVYTFGYAGCDTYLLYQCGNYGYCGSSYGTYLDVFGLSPNCRSIGLSCLRKVEDIVKGNCLPNQEYYVLPMKLPNRCVTQQSCVRPPNPFYGALPSHVSRYYGL